MSTNELLSRKRPLLTSDCNDSRKGTGNLLRDLFSSVLILEKTNTVGVKISKSSKSQEEQVIENYSKDCWWSGLTESCSICGLSNVKCCRFTPQEIQILQEFVLNKPGRNISTNFCTWICTPCSDTLRKLSKLKQEIENIAICLWTVIRIQQKDNNLSTDNEVAHSSSEQISDLGDIDVQQVDHSSSPTQFDVLELEITDIDSDSDSSEHHQSPLPTEKRSIIPSEVVTPSNEFVMTSDLPQDNDLDVDEPSAKESSEVDVILDENNAKRFKNVGGRKRINPMSTYHYKRVKKFKTSQIFKKYKSTSQHTKLKCKVCELEYFSKFHLNRHCASLLHKEGANSRRVTSNGEVTFACACCEIEFTFLAELVSHKRACQKQFNANCSSAKQKSNSRHQKVRCKVCELVYFSEYHLKRHSTSLLHKEGINSRRMGTNGEVTFACSCCQAEFSFLVELISHKKTCQKQITANSNSSNATTNSRISVEIKPDFDEDEEMKPVVLDMEFDLMETEQELENEESEQGDLDSIPVETTETDLKGNSNDVRPKRASRLLAEKKLRDMSQSNKKLLQTSKEPRKTPIDSDPLFCPRCQQLLPDIETMTNHKLALSNEKYKCDICDRCYCSKRHHRRHFSSLMHFQSKKCKKVSDNGDVIYACDRCDAKFDLLHQLLSHKRDVHAREEYFCKHCNKNLRNYKRFKSHLMSHSHVRDAGGEEAVMEIDQKKDFSCDTCGKIHQTQTLLRRHIWRHKRLQESQFICKKCGKRFTKQNDLDNHESNTKLHELLSKRAQKMGKDIFQLQRDQNYRSRNAFFRLTCEKCYQKFPDVDSITSHRLILTSGKYKCDTCDQCYCSEKKLKGHFSSFMHFQSEQSKKVSDNGDVIYACDKCDNEFHLFQELLSHKKDIHPGKDFFCEHCNLDLKFYNKLKDHLLTPEHIRRAGGDVAVWDLEQQKKFSCDICDKKYMTEKLLRNHIKAHKDVYDSRFVCKKCGQRFSARNALLRHESNVKLHELLSERAQELGTNTLKQQRDPQPRTREVRNPFICQICWEQFPDGKAMTSHKLGFNNGKYKCDICDLSCCSEKHRERHLLSKLHLRSEKCRKVSENGTVIYTCDRCDEEFNLLENFVSHKRDIHPIKEFFCEHCNIDLRNYRQFKEHLLTRSHVRWTGGEEAVIEMELRNNFSCDICDKKFITARLLGNHIRGHKIKDEAQYVCEKCGQKCVNAYALNRHLKIHTTVPNTRRLIEKLIICKKCPKRFVDERTMNKHLKICGIRVTCNLCSKDFEGWQRLQVHKSRMHSDQPLKKKPTNNERFTCEICSKTVTKKSVLTCHMELKHFPDKSSCPYGCSDKITNAQEWKHHLELCKSEKLTEQSKCFCWYCGQVFRTHLLLLEHHLSLHKSYSCEFCSRIFTRAKLLKLHRNGHKEKKPQHLCTKCGKRYRTVYSLQIHSTTVCGDDAAAKEELIKKRRELHRIFREKSKPLKCNMCSKRFIEKWRLEAHKKQVHQNQNELSESEDEESPPPSEDEES